jgi:hypothetical protein
VESNAQPEQNQTGPDATGFVIAPMAAAAALDATAFSKVNASEAVPATWEERARKAWEYYVEEPLVKNCVNSWRTFAVGDEIKIAGDDDKLKEEAAEPTKNPVFSGANKLTQNPGEPLLGVLQFWPLFTGFCGIGAPLGDSPFPTVACGHRV